MRRFGSAALDLAYVASGRFDGFWERGLSPWDIAANTAGALIGAGVPLNLLLIAAVSGWVGSGWLLTPAPPKSLVWWGQIAHRFPATARYSGAIESARINGLEVIDGRFNESETNRLNSWASDEALLLRVTATPPTTTSSRRAQLVSLVDGRGGEILGLWQRGRHLEVSWNSRGSHLGLYRGRVLTPPILTSTATSPSVEFLVQLTQGRIIVESDPGNGQKHSYDLRLGAWEGWRLFWPFTMTTPEIATVITWLWTIGAVAAGVVAALTAREYISRVVGRRQG